MRAPIITTRPPGCQLNPPLPPFCKVLLRISGDRARWNSRLGACLPGFGGRPLTPDPGTCGQVPPSQERWAPLPTGVYGAVLLAPGTPCFPLPTLRREPCRPSGYHSWALLPAIRAFSGVPSVSRRGQGETRNPDRFLGVLPSIHDGGTCQQVPGGARGDPLSALTKFSRGRCPVRTPSPRTPDGKALTKGCGNHADLVETCSKGGRGRPPPGPRWEGGPTALPAGEPVNRFLGRGQGVASEPFDDNLDRNGKKAFCKALIAITAGYPSQLTSPRQERRGYPRILSRRSQEGRFS
jgi:hypothetical protein